MDVQAHGAEPEINASPAGTTTTQHEQELPQAAAAVYERKQAFPRRFRKDDNQQQRCTFHMRRTRLVDTEESLHGFLLLAMQTT